VIIPKSLYPLVLDRLDDFATTAYKDPWLVRWAARRGPQGFLTRRCSKEFVALYLDGHPDLLDNVAKPGLLRHAVPEVDLAVRLHELGLLPEGHRKKFMAAVSNYALAGEDLYALEDPRIRTVFKAHEFDELLLRVRAEVLPRLGDIRRDWQSNYPSDDRPESHMQPLLDGLEALKTHFEEDGEASAKTRKRGCIRSASGRAQHFRRHR
jgi:hypothetical protein